VNILRDCGRCLEASRREVSPNTSDASNIGLTGGPSEQKKVGEPAALNASSGDGDLAGKRDASAT
jgi:hypothetical protein